MRNTYKILAELYNGLQGKPYEPERTVRQVPFTDDEYRVLSKLFDFRRKKSNSNELMRIYAPGEVETVLKYSDNTYVLMLDEGRGIVKHEYNHFYDLTKYLRQIYKANRDADKEQSIEGPDLPAGVTQGGPSHQSQS